MHTISCFYSLGGVIVTCGTAESTVRDTDALAVGRKRAAGTFGPARAAQPGRLHPAHAA